MDISLINKDFASLALNESGYDATTATIEQIADALDLDLSDPFDVEMGETALAEAKAYGNARWTRSAA